MSKRVGFWCGKCKIGCKVRLGGGVGVVCALVEGFCCGFFFFFFFFFYGIFGFQFYVFWSQPRFVSFVFFGVLGLLF
jgi:hypothetical protein